MIILKIINEHFELISEYFGNRNYCAFFDQIDR